MKYITGQWETMETAELLGELCFAEQLGYAGEIRSYEINLEINERWNAEKAEKAQAEAVEVAQEETPAQDEKTPVIDVFFEYGYMWSVHVRGEEESRNTSITKKEAMKLARLIRRNEFNLKAEINEQKLSKAERSENIAWLHENSYQYMRY